MDDRKKRVLVIDDDEPVRVFLSHMLKEEGYAVEVAKDGKEGQDLFVAKGFDAVVTDISMPNQDGIDTIIAIRECNPKVRIVAMSGLESKDRLLEIAEKYGADHVLAKPFEREEFLAAMRSLSL